MFMITNRHLTTKDNYLKQIEYWSYNGVNNIILREKDLNDSEFLTIYGEIKDIINPKCNLIINSKIQVYKELKCEYLHLPFNDFVKYSISQGEKVGVSVHSLEEGILADEKGAEYILASHIFETKCKEGLRPKGIEFIKALRNNIRCNIVALGGINMENKQLVLDSGADDIALMSYFFK